jgi:hypothetical protein
VNRPAYLCCLLLIAGCGAARTPITAPGITDPPRELLEFVESQWPRATVAQASASCASGGAATPVVSGDFNGDGLMDVVTWPMASCR